MVSNTVINEIFFYLYMNLYSAKGKYVKNGMQNYKYDYRYLYKLW